jgi:hypothetical protein
MRPWNRTFLAAVTLASWWSVPAVASDGPPVDRITCPANVTYPPPVTPGIVDNRSNQLFSYFPDTTFTTAAGVTLTAPFKGYNVVEMTLTGTGDLGAAQALVQGSGYVPTEIDMGNGLHVASVALYLEHMLDTSLGAYNEVGAWINVVPAGTPDSQRVVPYVNPYSTFVPGARGDTGFLLKLVPDSCVAIDSGRQFGGLDKSAGTLKLALTPYQFFQGSQSGRTFIQGQFGHSFGATDLANELSGLAQAFGVTSLPPIPPLVLWNSAHFDIRSSGTIALDETFIQGGLPVQVPFDSSKDFVEIDPVTPIGLLLTQLHFKTVLVGYGNNIMDVFVSIPTTSSNSSTSATTSAATSSFPKAGPMVVLPAK